MQTNSTTKKMVINAMLLALGALLHQITPVLGFPMQPDMSLAMLFIIIILNKEDYKSCLISAIVIGIFTAMTTKFPGGQLPNILDKIVTMHVSCLLISLLLKTKAIKNLPSIKENTILIYMILPIGTMVSGIVFLISASFIVGLPATFNTLFLTVVLPATLLNTAAGIFLFKAVNISLRRSSLAR